MISKFNRLPNIVKAVGLVTLISAIGKILGFVREAIIAAFFGTSGTADVFFVANMIPTLLYTVIGITIYSGIIPIYLEEKEKSQAKADGKISVLGTLFLVFALFITAVAFVFSDQLVKIVAPGFSPEQLELTSLLTKIMLPSIIFYTLTTIATGVLNAHKRFVAPALTGSAQSIIVILSTFILAERFGVAGLAIGVLLGTVFQFLIQYPSLSRYDIRLNFSFRKEKDTIKTTLIMFYPIIISSLAVQINGLTDRMISSGLDEGSVSSLNYASKLMQLPLSVILAPLISVLYPSIVEAAIRNMKDFVEIVIKGAKAISYISIPFIIVMVVCGQELIELAFERGAFDRDATMMTVNVFIFYSLGLVFLGLRDYLMNCLYALKKTKFAMYTSIIMVLTYVILSVILSKFFQASGIAIATSVASLLQTVFLMYFLWRQSRPEKQILRDLAVDILKYVTVFAVVLLIAKPIYPLVQDIPNIPMLVIMTIIVFAMFFGVSYLLKIKEISVFRQLIKKG